eukprot:368450-Pleurochrysis_carterae.AAC.1
MVASHRRLNAIPTGMGPIRMDIAILYGSLALGHGPCAPQCDSQNLSYSPKATYCPLRRWGEWRRGCPHLYIIVHPNTNILPDR